MGSGDSAALRQLKDMGIPRARAEAALVKAKDDVATAAERVFAGDHDDIPSDAEDIDDSDKPLASVNGSSKKPIEVASDDEDGDVVLSDDEDAFDGFSDDGDAGDEDDNVDVTDDPQMDDEIIIRSDPYAGIFFSKDRVDKVIETVEPEDWASVLPKGPGAPINVKILSAGEWMSGCPEGNEQSFLFQLYHKLAFDPLQCSSGCGHVFEKKAVDAFAVMPTFKAYLAHLAERTRVLCPQCGIISCAACGDKVDSMIDTLPFDLYAPSQSTSSPRSGSEQEDDRTEGKVENEPVPTDNVQIDGLLHCVDLQGLIIGMGLQIIDSSFKVKTKRQREHTDPAVHVRPKKTNLGHLAHLHKGADDDDDEHEDAAKWFASYSSGMGNTPAKGTGYAGDRGLEDRTGQLAAEKAQQERDAITTSLIRQVQTYLPQVDRVSGCRTSDHMVHPTALAHIRRRSGFVNDLLRNDSLLDMSNRSELYQALFDWLRVISNHEALASMLAMPQMRPAMASPVAGDQNLVEVTYEGSPSPRELLENVVIQAHAALKGLKQDEPLETLPADLSTEEMNRKTREEVEELKRIEAEKRGDAANVALRKFCENIIASAKAIDRALIETKGADFERRMKDALPRLPEADDDGEALGSEVKEGLSASSKEAVINIYEEWAGKTRFNYADLLIPDTSNYRHAYDAQLRGIANMTAPKRSLAIAKELAILTTNLPVAWHSTIFLRVDEARVDCIKAMIIGPEGTPYENGCFLFDIFLPHDHNVSCPLVKSMTTNGGQYRLNPNLYADGKVCLSLLGTWAGPGWVAGHSTLLQVLISIQSLILCEEPYCNEPGWAASAGSDQSKAYSANTRRLVVHDAMANNIRKPPEPFAKEIRTHFRLKANAIRDQLKEWRKLDDGRAICGANHGSYGPQTGKVKGGNRPESDFEKKAKELEALLDRLEKGEI